MFTKLHIDMYRKIHVFSSYPSIFKIVFFVNLCKNTSS